MYHILFPSDFDEDAGQLTIKQGAASAYAKEHISIMVVNAQHIKGCNIKLGSVITDISGKGGIAILKEIISGETDPVALSTLAEGRAKNKLQEIRSALQGRVLEHHYSRYQ